MVDISPIVNRNIMLNSDPDCDVVDRLFQGFAEFLILENTLKTDLLDQIVGETKGVTVATLSKQYGYHGDVLERLIDNLVCMKLLTKSRNSNDEWVYSATRTTSVYLTKKSPCYKGDALMADSMLLSKTSALMLHTLNKGPCNQMEQFMASGKMATNFNSNNNVLKSKENTNRNDTESRDDCNSNSNETQNRTACHNGNETQNRTVCNNGNETQNRTASSINFDSENSTTAEETNSNHHKENKNNNNNNNNNKGTVENKNLNGSSMMKMGMPPAKILMRSMDAMMYSCRHVLPVTFDLSGHRKAVDLGGATGYLARMLTDFYPQLSTTVFELPHVVALATSQNQGDVKDSRVSYVAGNFFEDVLPPADLYILSHVLHAWEDVRIQMLLDKIFTSLPPGGKLLILEKFLNENKDGPRCVMNVHLNMSSLGCGRERTAVEYGDLVESRGFADTQIRIIEGVNLFDALLTAKPF